MYVGVAAPQGLMIDVAFGAKMSCMNASRIPFEPNAFLFKLLTRAERV